MPGHKQPNHRLQNLRFKKSRLSDNGPEVLAIANFENQYHLSRRDFLSGTAKIATLIGLTPLLLQSGCASSERLKVKVPKTVTVKNEDAKIRKEPNGDVVCSGHKGDKYRVLEAKGEWLKVRAKERCIGWIAEYDVIIVDYREWTMPCGSPIPPGAICVCNCVPVAAPRPVNPPSRSSTPTLHRTCSCVPVCTCNLIPVS